MKKLGILLCLLFFGMSLTQAKSWKIGKELTYFTTDTTDGYEFQTKRKLEDRYTLTVLNGMNLSFLMGKDASTIKTLLKANLGKKEVYPRIGYFFRMFNNINIVKGFDVVLGVGYDQKGWFERHDTYTVQTLNTSSNDVYVRTDYASLYLGAMYHFSDKIAVRTGLDMGIHAFSYFRTGKWIGGNLPYYTGIDRRSVKPVLPSYDIGMSIGPSNGFRFDLGMQYSGKVFKNIDYNYMMLKVGVTYGFQMIVPQQNYL